jgi:hypothetical protein
MPRKEKISLPKWIHFLWLIPIFLAAFYAVERLLYQDSAFFLFRICNLQSVLENSRYAAYIAYLPSYAAVYLGLPLICVLYILSLTPAILSWLGSICIYKLTQNTMLSLMPLLCFFCVGPEMFFLTVSEMQMALLYVCFFLSSFEFRMKPIAKKLIASAALVLAFNAHPGVLPALILAIIWIAFGKGLKTIFAPFLVLLFIALAKFLFSQNSGYETALIDNIEIIDWRSVFSAWSMHYFLAAFKSWMLFPGILLVLWMLFSLFEQKFVYTSIYVLACLFFCLLIVVIYKNGDSDPFMQKSFAPVTVAFAWPFLLDYLPIQIKKTPSKKSILAIPVMAVMLAFSVYLITQTAKFYQQRLNRLESLSEKMAQSNLQKHFVHTNYFKPEDWHVIWAIPYETALFAALKCKQSVTVNLYNHAFPTAQIQKSKGLFLGADFAYPIPTHNLNKKYFNFTDTSMYRITQLSVNGLK